MKLGFKLSLILCSLMTPALSQAGSRGYNAGLNEIKVSEGYFTSSANLNSNSNIADLGGVNTFTHSESRLKYSHDFKKPFSIFSDIGLGYSRSVANPLNRTKVAPTDFQVGTDFSLWNPGKSTYFIPEFSIRIPFARVNPSTTDALVGDGTMDIQGGLYFSTWMSSTWNFYAYGGYIYRDDGRASKAAWSLNTLFDWSNFLLEADFSGFSPASSDQYTDSPSTRKAVTDAVNAGSLYFYSVNPRLIQFSTWLGFRPSHRIEIKVGAGYPVVGTNTGFGPTFYASLSTSWGGQARAIEEETEDSNTEATSVSTDVEATANKSEIQNEINVIKNRTQQRSKPPADFIPDAPEEH